jgi:hypothetical protein
MPDPRDFNMDFRPSSYWPEIDDKKLATSPKVKGALRRQFAKILNDKGLHDPEIHAESLSDDHRIAAGKVHPMFMGGEYLPDLLRSEVEIARVTLKSTMMDVISIRARLTRHRIIYRIVDEYEDEGKRRYNLIQKTSVMPLKMRKLIALIDGAIDYGLIGNAREYNYDAGSEYEEVYNFATITSDFYPELHEWYNQSNLEWLDDRREEKTGLTKEEWLAEEYHDRFISEQPSRTTEETQWRERNKESLEIELTEHKKFKMNLLWEKRYKNGEDAQSDDERLWRAENSRRLDFEIDFKSKFDNCVNNYSYEHKNFLAGKGGAHGAFLFRCRVAEYVSQYMKCHGDVPRGKHQVRTSIGSSIVSFNVIFH